MPELSASIAYDPAPEEGPTAVRAAAAAWRRVADDATHHLVLQDDALPCAGFGGLVRRAVGAQPSRPLTFFAPWSDATAQLARVAAITGRTWCPLVEYATPSVAIILPRELAEGYADHLDRHRGSVHGRDSALLADFLRAAGREPLLCVPNPVDHDRPRASSCWPRNFLKGMRRSVCFRDDVRGGTAINAESVGRPRIVPYVNPQSMTSVWLTGHRRVSLADYRPRSVVDLLNSTGFSDRELVGHFHGRIRQDLPRAAEALFNDALLFEVWVTAFALGATSGVDPPEHPDHGPAARAALGTLAPGAVQRLLTPDAVGAVTDMSARLCREAMSLGARLARGGSHRANGWLSPAARSRSL